MRAKKIVVTGAAGQITYSLLFHLAGGDLFGNLAPIELYLLELPRSLEALQGVVMELKDCAFPLLKSVKIGSNPFEIFEGCDYAFLVGAKPRTPGQERKDLLQENAKIFVEQGKALNEVASRECKVLVVGNPCNTNCLITQRNAPKLAKTNFFAMTRLDQNRATALIAEKANVLSHEVTHVTIWGNHSATQVPDFYHAKVKDKPAINFISDTEAFSKEIQERGTQILKARGKSSAASAAKAAVDAMKALIEPTKEGLWYSTGIISDKNPYGIQEGIVFSFPCQTTKEGEVKIVKDLDWNEDLRQKIRLSEKELLEEASQVIKYV